MSNQPLRVVAELPKGRTGVRETEDVYKAVRRFVFSLGRRASSDIDALPYLVEVAQLAEQQLAHAVQGCVAAGWSYGDVARVLGVSRQAVHQRFAGPGD
jgi:hypothetical protein